MNSGFKTEPENFIRLVVWLLSDWRSGNELKNSLCDKHMVYRLLLYYQPYDET